jgi:hypothetical protein
VSGEKAADYLRSVEEALEYSFFTIASYTDRHIYIAVVCIVFPEGKSRPGKLESQKQL